MTDTPSPAEPQCKTCKDIGEVDCPNPDCDDGVCECPVCGGDLACEMCNGGGVVPCPDCNAKETKS